MFWQVEFNLEVLFLYQATANVQLYDGSLVSVGHGNEFVVWGS